MSLVFSAIVPHPPQLLQTKDAPPSGLSETLAAYQTLSDHLYSAKPDILVLITPHGETLPSAWQLLVDDKLTGNLKDFGDFSTDLKVNCGVGFSHRLKERAEDHRFTVLLQSGRNLDYASVIPLYFLTEHLKDIRVVSLSVSGEDISAHYELGKLLREEIFSTNDRVAVIASANLSHRLTKESPSGYSPQGKVFDKRILSALDSGQINEIISTPQDLTEEAMTCGLRPISLLLGSLFRKSLETEILAYQFPQGVGYCTAELISH